MDLRTIGLRFSIYAAVLVSGLLLSACSSKPESSDIAKQLSGFTGCDTLVITNVKKIEGIARDNGFYEVAYSFDVEMAGGKDAASKYFMRWLALDREIEAVDKEIRRPRMEFNPEADRILNDKANALRDERTKLDQCSDTAPAIQYLGTRVAGIWHGQMQGWFSERAKSSKDMIAVPLGVHLTGAGVMVKAESGWVFQENAPGLRRGEIFESEPVPFTQPVATVAVAAPIDSPSAANVASESVNPSPIQAQESSTAPAPGGPSFDCAKASTAVEKLICANPSIASMDRDVANVYREMLQKSNNKNYEKERQATWRSTERDACTDAACLTDKYRMRLVEIQKTLGK